jgi:hypothetical protein
MAVWVVVKFILAIGALGVGYFTLMPMIYDLQNQALEEVPADRVEEIEQMYELYNYIPVMLFGALLLFAILAATRRETSESFI